MPQVHEPARRDDQVSELILADRLIALAQEAERAGFLGAARRLVRLACDVFDEAAVQPSY